MGDSLQGDGHYLQGVYKQEKQQVHSDPDYRAHGQDGHENWRDGFWRVCQGVEIGLVDKQTVQNFRRAN